MVDAEDDEAAANDSFSSLATPDIQQQDAMHKKRPAAMQPPKPSARRLKRQPDADADFVFKKVFKMDGYRGQQKEIMKAALDNLDVVVIAPTGMGKSLCYQVPALAERHGITIVISPLISLMEDQLKKLVALRMPAAMLTSTTPYEESRRIFSDMHAGHPKTRLLYITPERAIQANFLKKLAVVHAQRELSRFVIDEVHCIDQWASFRAAYTELGKLRDKFPNVPIMALTASSTEETTQKIIRSLKLEEKFLYIASHSFNRPNIFYQIHPIVENEEVKFAHLLAYIRKQESRPTEGTQDVPKVVTGIVYCRTRAACEILADKLCEKGVKAGAYHRGLKDDVAKVVSDKWMDNDARAAQGLPYITCVVATIALGMGIDKSSCRYVVHWHLPNSMDAYYQETGRAGRDRRSARALLYFTDRDAKSILSFQRTTSAGTLDLNSKESARETDKKRAQQLLAYCKDTEKCRHLAICDYFGEVRDADEEELFCQRFCDNCKRLKPKGSESPREVEPEPQEIPDEELPPENAPVDLENMFADDDSVETVSKDVDAEMENPSPKVQTKPKRNEKEGGKQQKDKETVPSKRSRNAEESENEETSPKSVKRMKEVSYSPPPVSKKAKGKQRQVTPASDVDELEEDPLSPSKQVIRVDPSPRLYKKAIDGDYRVKGVKNIYKRLRDSNLRQAEDLEDDIFEVHNASLLSLHQKKTALMLSAKEIESDLFWASVTTDGYNDRIKSAKDDIASDGKKTRSSLERAIAKILND